MIARGIPTPRQESWRGAKRHRASSLIRDNATAGTPTLPTNCRLLQQFADDLPHRLRKQARGKGANLVAVALAAGCTFELTWLRLGTRDDERYWKNQKAAGRLLCCACRARPALGAPAQGMLALAGGGG